MARYIDADFVANGLREHLPPDDDEHREALDQLTYAISILQFAPTAEVAPVVHARFKPYPENIFREGQYMKCTNCGKTFPYRFGVLLEWEYCPCCGAIMDEEAGV